MLCCIASTAALNAGAPAQAAPLALPDAPYNYTVLDQDLAETLREFGSNLNVKVNVSSEVTGRIRGRIPELAPRDFLDHLARLYNLQWYYDGLVLYITAAKEAQSRLFVLTPITFATFKSTLDALNVSDERFVVKPAPGNGLVLASGPPRFVALTEQTLNGLVAEAQARPRETPPVEQPREEQVLLQFRGTQTTIIRHGRVEQQVPPAVVAVEPARPDGMVRAPALEPKE